MTSVILQDFPVTNLSDDSNTTLYELALNRRVVIDFWTTKCTRCPAALEKLNDIAEKNSSDLFISCVLNDKEVAADIVSDGSWENMTHIFVEPEVKESLKAQFGFTEVPYCLVVNSNHEVLGSGNPKDLNITELLKSNSSTSSSTSNNLSTNVFDSDDF